MPRLVDALEADRDDRLPAPVYVRGFIRAYCRAYCAQVGADPEEALRLYEERVGPPPPLTVPAPRPPTQAFRPGPPLSPLLAPAPPVPTTTAWSPGAPGPAERVLVMRAVEATWIRVQPDGGESSEETLAPGTVREWRSPGRFHVTLGNAGGVELELDGQALPVLGGAGQVVRDVTRAPRVQP